VHHAVSCSPGACGRPGSESVSCGRAPSGPSWWPRRRREWLKPRAIDIHVSIDPLHRILSPAKGTRSSLCLTDAATGLQVHGLGLDSMIVTCPADLRWSRDDCSYQSFHVATCTDVKRPRSAAVSEERLPRVAPAARLGIVIFVPPGAKRQDAKPPRFSAAPKVPCKNCRLAF